MNYPAPKFDPGRDMRAPKFAKILQPLASSTPVCTEWEALKPPRNKWWGSQRSHMYKWFSDAEGPGGYGRRRPQTAGQTYSRLMCAPAIIWIAEALGEDEEIVRAAANDAYSRKGAAAQCAALRRHIPWTRIFELTKQQ